MLPPPLKPSSTSSHRSGAESPWTGDPETSIRLQVMPIPSSHLESCSSSQYGGRIPGILDNGCWMATRSSWSPGPDDKIGRHGPLALDVDDAAGLADVGVLDEQPRGFTDVDAAGHSVRLHPAGGVDGVSPDVVLELRSADHTGDRRTRADAHPQLEEMATAAVMGGLQHVQPEVDQHRSVVNARGGHTCGDHVGVADRADLLQPPPLGHFVQTCEESIEHGDELFSTHAGAER